MASVSEKLSANAYQNTLPYARRNADHEVHAAYQAEEARLHDEFRRDALAELEITDHPKADLLFSKAWEMGHAYGYSEVWSYMQDLVDLVR